MVDTFGRIAQDLEEEGSGGIARELREAAEKIRRDYITKMVTGRCRNEKSYAHAVGVIAGLNYLLDYAANKIADAQRDLNDEQNEED